MLVAGLVQPGDASALARELQSLLADPARRQQLAAAGRQHAEECFDLRRNVATLLDWFSGKTPAAVTA